MWLPLIPLFWFAGVVVVGGQEEQDAEIVGSGHVSLVPGVPRHPPWLGVPKDRLMPPPP